MNKRSFVLKDIKLRAEKTESGERVLIGVIPYNSQGESIGGRYKEIITETAFLQDLQDKKRVVALKNHNDDYPLGNTEKNTLTLQSTKDGLECRCILPETSYAADLITLVERGDAAGMSFGFISRKEEVKDGIVYLVDVQLLEVSYGVVFPFYREAAAGVGVRSALENLIIRGGETMGEDVIQALKNLVSVVQGIIDKAASGASGGQAGGTPPAAEKPETAPPSEKKDETAQEEKEKQEEQGRAALAEQKKKRALLSLEVMDI